MTEDRDLLIGAAKAIGVSLVFSTVADAPPRQAGTMEAWSPLTSSADAFDLQVGLKMDVAYYGNHVRATINHRFWAVSLVHPDRDTATKRAIVLAAYKLGKDLP